MDDHCVLCGTCLEVCPQNAKTFVSDLEKVRAFITMGEKTIVSLAPAYLGIFDYDKPGPVSYTHLDVYKRQVLLWLFILMQHFTQW